MNKEDKLSRRLAAAQAADAAAYREFATACARKDTIPPLRGERARAAAALNLFAAFEAAALNWAYRYRRLKALGGKPSP